MLAVEGVWRAGEVPDPRARLHRQTDRRCVEPFRRLRRGRIGLPGRVEPAGACLALRIAPACGRERSFRSTLRVWQNFGRLAQETIRRKSEPFMSSDVHE